MFKRAEYLKIAAGALGLFILAALLFSSFLITEELDHDCSGHDCPVCALIEQCKSALRQVSGGLTAPAAALVPAVFMIFTAISCACHLPQLTPVSNKVRLNN